MAIGKKIWKGETVIAETNGYGGAVADLAADGAYDHTSDIDLETNGYEGALVQLEHDSSGTTDNIILGIFSSLDGTNFSANPIFEIEFDASGGGDTMEAVVVVKDLSHFRVGVKTNGTTDTFDYQIIWDAWRWDIS